MSSRHALIVGINQYPHLTSLHLPASDAEAVAQILQQQGDFHVKRLPMVSWNEQIVVGQKTPVSLEELEQALVELFKPDSAQIPDVGLFYFAGHGVRKQKGLDENYLVTSDSNFSNVWGLSLQWLRRLLQESPIKTQIVWLDCCYSGGLLNFQEADPRDAGFARDRCFIAASRAFEVAYEEVAGNHGVLTNALLQGLDCTHKPQVTNLDLTTFISQQLKNTTQATVALNSGEAIVLTRHKKLPKQPANTQKTKSEINYTDFVKDAEITALKVPSEEILYSSYQPEFDKENFLRLKMATTNSWIKEDDLKESHLEKVSPNESFTLKSGIKYWKVKNEIYIIKDPIRRFETQIGITRTLRPGGKIAIIATDDNIQDGFKDIYSSVFQLEKHRTWIAKVLAEIISDSKILDYMYHHTKTEQSVKDLISKNPYAPKKIQEEDCLFCNPEFIKNHEVAGYKHVYIINNDYPYSPYFHYVVILKKGVHLWTELEEVDLREMNMRIKEFLNEKNKEDKLHNSLGVEIGLNSSTRHLVLGKKTHSSAGASIAHIHKQVYGVSPVFETLGDYLEKLCKIYNQQGIDYLGSYLNLLKKANFIIWEDEYVALYVPFGQISKHELQIIIKDKNKNSYLELGDNEISSFSKAEFIVTRIYEKLEINSFNEIMISKKFNSDTENFRLIFTFITREVDIAIAELSFTYVVDSHPQDTVQKIKDIWDKIKKECSL